MVYILVYIYGYSLLAPCVRMRNARAEYRAAHASPAALKYTLAAYDDALCIYTALA